MDAAAWHALAAEGGVSGEIDPREVTVLLDMAVRKVVNVKDVSGDYAALLGSLVRRGLVMHIPAKKAHHGGEARDAHGNIIWQDPRAATLERCEINPLGMAKAEALSRADGKVTIQIGGMVVQL
jgi:hypothetical protein